MQLHMGGVTFRGAPEGHTIPRYSENIDLGLMYQVKFNDKNELTDNLVQITGSQGYFAL